MKTSKELSQKLSENGCDIESEWHQHFDYYLKNTSPKVKTTRSWKI